MHPQGISLGLAISFNILASFIAISLSLFSRGLYLLALDLKSLLHIWQVHIINNGSTSNLHFLQKSLLFFIQKLSPHLMQAICSLVMGLLQ